MSGVAGRVGWQARWGGWLAGVAGRVGWLAGWVAGRVGWLAGLGGGQGLTLAEVHFLHWKLGVKQIN